MCFQNGKTAEDYAREEGFHDAYQAAVNKYNNSVRIQIWTSPSLAMSLRLTLNLYTLIHLTPNTLHPNSSTKPYPNPYATPNPNL